jgi:cytochrome c oxidase cbb3-type subunit 3
MATTRREIVACAMRLMLASLAMTLLALSVAPSRSAAQPPSPPAAAAGEMGGLQCFTCGKTFDAAIVERGRTGFVATCGFCHGGDARGGGGGGSNLIGSSLVQNDENGQQLGAFLRQGRPANGMPAFDLPAAQVAEIATFLHSEITYAANRRIYVAPNILTGDPRAGQAYFNGAGRCSTCHSPTGDLKGVGAKYEPMVLQGLVVLPRRGTGPSYLTNTALRATVTLSSGRAVSGVVARLNDFEVTLYDPATRQMQSFTRKGKVPKVTVTNPIQGHYDLLNKWTDTDMHNVTAYLAGLK